jgi:RNA polymerase-binding protein DksA
MAKKAASKKSAKKPAKKPAKESVKKKPANAGAKTAKKAGKPAARAKTKSSGKEPSMAGKTKKAPATKSGPKADKKVEKKGKKSDADKSDKKPALMRSATKVSGKGVLIRTKRPAAAPAPVVEERVKLRHVNATEKSKGENPITLHHRKPTKAESDEFRELLIQRRNQLQGDVNGLEAEAFSDETQHVSSNHLADSSFEQYEQEFNLSMIENESEELREIARALDKITQGSFGVCEACGIDISIERLRVMPYTRICIHCRSKFEEEGGGEEYGVHPERRV